MSMTVKDLREALADLPDDTPVVMAKDAEENGYSPLADASEAMYAAETTWSGDCYLTPEALAADPQAGEYDEAPDAAVRCLLLGPVN